MAFTTSVRPSIHPSDVYLVPDILLLFSKHTHVIIIYNLLQSWEALPPDTATFTSDITPLTLAAHRDNYEIIKLLLDRGATLPMPHDIR